METRPSKKLKKSLSEADDRISNLPDHVLIHILSFIPTLDSVATCILSKRWKNLWKHVSVLTFDDTLPPFKPRFYNIVNKFLDLHVPEVLQKVSLTCKYYSIYDVGNWVTKSIMRNIQSLYLTICNYSPPPAYRSPVRLPSNLFTCNTLEALVLIGRRGSIVVNVPKVICLPKLKKLELVGLEYQYDQGDCLGKLISACSSLESLLFVEHETQVNCLNGYLGTQTICSSTLRDVEFQLCHRGLIGYEPEIYCSAWRRLSLSLDCFCSKTIRVPSNVLTCETLEHLSLKGRFVICASRTICLPKLTFLALHRVEFEDDEIFSRLISNCISLESLSVNKTMESELNISSCTLKVIEVELCCGSKPGHKLVINAPALKCLKLSNMGYVDYHMEDLSSLEQADISIGFFWDIRPEYCSSVLTNAYQPLQHVKSLKVHQNYSNVGVDHVLPMFNRLTELDVTINSWVGYGLFQKLIKNSTKLQNLTFGLHFEVLFDHNERNLSTVPACLLSSLKCVSISCFEGREDELAMICYILGNAKVMEKMEVCFSQSNLFMPMKRELCKKILSVRRGSENCEVVFIK